MRHLNVPQAELACLKINILPPDARIDKGSSFAV
jgi:hypothetical protein